MNVPWNNLNKVGEGIRVNTVSPGRTRTDMLGQDVCERGASIIPVGRVGDPREIAEAVLWLLSENASFIAGANIRGGLHAHGKIRCTTCRTKH